MAEKLIDIAGKLHAATVEGILADSEQISYGDSNVKTTLDELKSGTTGGLLTLDVESIDIPCPECGGKVLIKRTKTRRPFYVCENNTNSEDSKCHYISWTKPKVKKS